MSLLVDDSPTISNFQRNVKKIKQRIDIYLRQTQEVVSIPVSSGNAYLDLKGSKYKSIKRGSQRERDTAGLWNPLLT